MTRRPIFIGVATVLALALTAGLAYGAGRMVSTRSYANQAGRQGSQGMVAVAHGSSWGTSVNGQVSQANTAYRNQMRQWMQDRFQSWLGHRAAGNRWDNRGRGHVSTGAVNAGTSYQGSGSNYQGDGYQHNPGYHHEDHVGSGSWGGSGDHHDGCCGWC